MHKATAYNLLLMAKFEITARIPMRPYLLKYVRTIENLEDEEVLDLHRNGLLPYLLQWLVGTKADLLSSMRQYKDGNKQATIREQFTGQLPVKITRRMEKHWRMYWTAESIFMFDRLVHKHFHDTLGVKILEGIQQGQNEKDVIEGFLRSCGITEDDIGFDSVKKAATRWRNDKKIADLNSQKCPQG